MGAVLQHLESLIRDQIEHHGIVVWYDPQGRYGETVAGLDLSDAKVEHYAGSFYELRYRLEELLSGLSPPRLLVYVPMAQSETGDALAELQAAGVVLRPGQQPPSRNTRLAVVARNAARERAGWSRQQADRLASDVEDGKYASVAEIEEILERGGPDWGALRVIFGTDNPESIALEFLNGDQADDQIRQKEVQEDLRSLLNEEFGTDFGPGDDLATVRRELASHILATDFLANMTGEPPEELRSLRVAGNAGARRACVSLAQRWRSQQRLQTGYREHAERLETGLSLRNLPLRHEQLEDVETFLAVDKLLQEHVEEALLKGGRPRALEIARQRRTTFWPRAVGAVQARWALIEAAGVLSSLADSVGDAIETPPKSLWAFAEAYTGGDTPWCALDTAHRHMEARAHSFEFDLDGSHDGLTKLLARARERYMEVGGRLADEFLECWYRNGFATERVLSQREVFSEFLRAELSEIKTAYVLVDALRYEMAQELISELGEGFTAEIQPVLGAMPGITSVGMGALMPGAEQAVDVVMASDGKLGMEIGGEVLHTRQDRMAWLEDQVGVKTACLHLGDLLPSPSRRTRNQIEKANLIVMTSQEIDDLCEGDNVLLARTVMEDLLRKLSRGLRVLAELGVERIVMAADHGYIFLRELSSDMKLDAPGGETVELHRRVWIGRGGTADVGFVRASLPGSKRESEFDIAVPRGFACFKVAGGGTSYFHGGVSPQESIIPVVVLTASVTRPAQSESGVQWTLRLGSKKVTTRFLSVQIGGVKAGLLDVPAPRVNLELRSDCKVVSQAVSSSYGFQEGTGAVQLRWEGGGRELEKNTVSLMLKETPSSPSVSLHMLDTETGRELKRIEDIPVDLAL